MTPTTTKNRNNNTEGNNNSNKNNKKNSTTGSGNTTVSPIRASDDGGCYLEFLNKALKHPLFRKSSLSPSQFLASMKVMNETPTMAGGVAKSTTTTTTTIKKPKRSSNHKKKQPKKATTAKKHHRKRQRRGSGSDGQKSPDLVTLGTPQQPPRQRRRSETETTTPPPPPPVSSDVVEQEQEPQVPPIPDGSNSAFILGDHAILKKQRRRCSSSSASGKNLRHHQSRDDAGDLVIGIVTPVICSDASQTSLSSMSSCETLVDNNNDDYDDDLTIQTEWLPDDNDLMSSFDAPGDGSGGEGNNDDRLDWDILRLLSKGHHKTMAIPPQDGPTRTETTRGEGAVPEVPVVPSSLFSLAYRDHQQQHYTTPAAAADAPAATMMTTTTILEAGLREVQAAMKKSRAALSTLGPTPPSPGFPTKAVDGVLF